jgi:hypothetical protein
MKLRQRIRLALGRVASTRSTPFGEKPMTFGTSGSAAGKGEVYFCLLFLPSFLYLRSPFSCLPVSRIRSNRDCAHFECAALSRTKMSKKSTGGL